MNRMLRQVLFITFTIALCAVRGQSSSAILQQYAQFNSGKTVLYMAAHPDDENTRVISWLVNGAQAKTAYLSLTRGDGGQNLIGTEFGDALGILRTQELLAARNIDGGEQFFTRAVDFGYSKSATETLDKWGEEEILADVVWAIRTFKPQIIITRFPPDARAGHGHHTASAMLAIKGAEAAADPNRFPEQLLYVSPWQVQSVYWNTSSWWDKTVAAEMDTNKTIWRADIGGYNPNLGVSYNELGSLARSQHKCQGFGVDIQRGETFEYFRLLWGKALPNGLADLQTENWQSLGVKSMPKLLSKFEKGFKAQHPEDCIDVLIQIYKALDQIENPYWRARKKEQCANLIMACGGFFAEALAPTYAAMPASTVPVEVNILSRNTDVFSIEGLSTQGGQITFKTTYKLPKNQFATFSLEARAPDEISNPYWLQNPHTTRYALSNPVADLGRPTNRPTLYVTTQLLVQDVTIPLTIPVRYKWRDRVEGELQRDLVVVPPVTINFDTPIASSLNSAPVSIKALVTFHEKGGQAKLKFRALGWHIQLADSTDQDGWLTVSDEGLGRPQMLQITLTPQPGVMQGELDVFTPTAMVCSYQEIAYGHIPTQVFMPKARVSLTNLQVNTVGKKVAYIPGAGDHVADAIAQMGYQVDILTEANFEATSLAQYQAVVVGIRAYNTQAWLQGYTDKILAYVNNGGNYIVQYNTASRFLQDAPLIPAPYPFTVGRGRVTEEDSPVALLLPEHPVLNTPNRISQQDFAGWVQERGLYFADTWDSAYAAPIGWHDQGEDVEQGGLIIADYGRGAFMYTGISFFRILPAGVEGGYRLLANLISYEKE